VKKLSILVVLACTAAAFAAGAAHATFTCSGTVSDMTINDNVIVPNGSNCRLVRVTVNGNVNVQQGGALIVLNTHITGNLQSIGARWIRIDNGSRIDGTTQIIGTTGTPPNFTVNVICGSTLNGGLQLSQNSAPFTIGNASDCSAGNTFGGNVQITNNTAKVRIARNTIRGNLQCAGNRPQATGNNNQVTGVKQGEGCTA